MSATLNKFAYDLPRMGALTIIALFMKMRVIIVSNFNLYSIK